MKRCRVRIEGLHAGQAAVAASDARFRVLCCGRRWGKTRLAVGLAIHAALEGQRAWWVAPSYKLASVGWRALQVLGRRIPGAEVRLGEHRILAPGGGWVEVRTAGEPGGLRGEGLDFVVYDEAAQGSEDSWLAELRPALSDRKGRALFTSTPRGRANWFHRIWQLGSGADPEWAAWRFTTADNPHIDPDEIAAAQEMLPGDVFEQEYLAEFTDAGTRVFNLDDVEQMVAAWTGLADPRNGGEYLTAWDIGRRSDPAVGITVDYSREPYQVVAFERLLRTPYPEQQRRIEARHALYPGRTVVESNGAGDPVIENLRIKAVPFVTTARSKTQAIQALQLLAERGVLGCGLDDVRREMVAYEWDDRSLVQDCVMALAIAALHLPAPGRGPAIPPPVGGVNRTAMGDYRGIEL